MAVSANLSLSFEPNLGQTEPQAKFLSRSRSSSLFFVSTGANFLLHPGDDSAALRWDAPSIYHKVRLRRLFDLLSD